MTWDIGIRIMTFGLLGVLVLSGVLLPIFSTAAEVVPESFSSVDCIAAYATLMGAAAVISPYIMTAPRGMGGELVVQERWYGTAKRVVCEHGSAIGMNFAEALVESNYVEKHAGECAYQGACESLNYCTLGGKDILDPSFNDDQKEVILLDICLDCLQVANYLLRKNQYMAQKADATDGELTMGWTQFPP